MAKHRRRTHRTNGGPHRAEPAAESQDILSQMGRMLGDSMGYVRDAGMNVAAGTGRAAADAFEVTRRVTLGIEHAAEAAVTATIRGAGDIGGAAVGTVRSMALAAAAGMETFAQRTRPHQPEPMRGSQTPQPHHRAKRRRRHRAAQA